LRRIAALLDEETDRVDGLTAHKAAALDHEVCRLIVGALSTRSSQRRSDLLTGLPVEEYNLAVARFHARLLAHTRRTGTTRNAHDLIIAATAVARDRTVLTTDQKGFADLPGVDVQVLEV
jgi:tRNA(fMet)-specific endonuclease VapC